MLLDPIALIQAAERSGSEARSALPDAPRRAEEPFAGFRWRLRLNRLRDVPTLAAHLASILRAP
jgi:hypothetical protein